MIFPSGGMISDSSGKSADKRGVVIKCHEESVAGRIPSIGQDRFFPLLENELLLLLE